jgi:hypothetical protein
LLQLDQSVNRCERSGLAKVYLAHRFFHVYAALAVAPGETSPSVGDLSGRRITDC